MGEMLVIDGPGRISFEQYQERELKENEVRLATLYS